MTSLSVGFGRRGPGSGLKELGLRAAMLALGLAVLFGCVTLAAVLATYNPEDASFNAASAAVPSNIGGPTGAFLADMLQQTVGDAAYLLPVVLLFWAARLLQLAPLRQPLLRVLGLPPMLLLASLGLGCLSSHLGGLVGLLAWRIPALAEISIVVAMLVAMIFGLLLSWELGLSPAEWLALGRKQRREWAAAERSEERASAARREMAAGDAAREAQEAKSGSRWGWKLKLPRLPGFRPKLRDPSQGKADRASKPARPWADRREPDMGALPGADAEAQDFAADAPVSRSRWSVAPDIVAPKPAAPAPGKREQAQRQPMLDLDPERDYELPPLQVLSEPPPERTALGPSETALQQNAVLLLSVLEDYGVRGEIVKVRPGPVVTLYELEPAPGTKSARVIGLADDIARSMSAISVRVAVVPGRNVIGIELPNARAETVYLRELLGSGAYERATGKLPLVLGKDIGGGPVIADLAKMPHLLIAGTTGSGKSVGINTMILSILYRMSPDECKFIMIDPKMLELSIYDDIPHLLSPVVTDPKKAVVALKWTVREMETRYRHMTKLGVRNIEGYNQRIAEAAARGETLSRRVQTGFDPETGDPTFEDQPLDSAPLPFIVVVVDEMADLMLVAGKDIEAAIQRLAQMARAAGIHIIMATQRPSVDVITGTIKANFPTRISFQVTSKIDSRTILGESGAEQLLGKGDLLYMAGGGRIIRVHGPFVSDGEVEAVVSFLKRQGKPDYLEEVTTGDDDAPLAGGEIEAGGRGGSDNELYDQAVAVVTRERRASTSFVQRQLRIGYNSAARLMEQMEKEGVVSQADRNGKREVLAPPPR